MVYAVSQNFTFNQSKANLISKSGICLVVGIGSLVIYTEVVVTMGQDELPEMRIILEGNSTVLNEATNIFQTIANKTVQSTP